MLVCVQQAANGYIHGRKYQAKSKQLLQDLASKSSPRGGSRPDKAEIGCYQSFSQNSLAEPLCKIMWEGDESQGPFRDRKMDALAHMDQQGIVPSVEMYRCLLKDCTKTKALAQAKQLHAHLAKHGLEETNLGEYVVVTLVKCGGLEDGLNVFHRLPGRTVVSWSAVISGYTSVGQGQEALAMYQSMREEGVEPDKYTFVSVLKACGSISDLQKGRHIHAEVLRYGCGSDLFVGTCLLDMYGKCGSIMDAKCVFDGLYEWDVVSWNAMLAAYTWQNQGENALQLYGQMLQEGVNPDHRTFVTIIQACGMIADIEEDVSVNGQPTKAKTQRIGKVLHAEAERKDYLSDVFVGSTLISMYGKCGSLMDAQNLFGFLPQRNLVSWNSMLSAFVEKDQEVMALELYGQMVEEGVSADVWTFVRVIQACGMFAQKEENVVVDGQLIKPVSLDKGKAIHFAAWKNGYKSDVFVSNNLVSMYGKCMSIVDAQNVFDNSSQRNVVSWNAMLAGCAQAGQSEKAFRLYEQVLEDGESPNDRTFATVLQVCGMLADKDEDHVLSQHSATVRWLESGKAIHYEAMRRGHELDVFVASSLITMYGKCGSIFDAQNVFERLSQHTVVSWNALLVAYIVQSQVENALLLYGQILEEGFSPDQRTFVSALQACGMLAEKLDDNAVDGAVTNLRFLHKGRVIHAEAWNRGYTSEVFVVNTLVSMYSKCRSICDAQIVFNSVSHPDLVSWNALLVAYAQQGQAEKVLLLYEQMLEEGVSPDDWTFVSVIQACCSLADKEAGMSRQSPKLTLEKGKAIHAEAWKRGYNPDGLIGNTLVVLYGKCESIVDAQNMLDDLSERYILTWNTMLAAYVHQGLGEKALQLYREMEEEGASLNAVTLVFVLQACSSAGSWDVCNQIYHHLLTSGYELDQFLANSLIHVFGTCGGMREAQYLFDALPQANVVSWNALMSGYARQGNAVASLQCYEHMQIADVEPDGVTFVSLISACSHAGLVDKGLRYFELMTQHHGITPRIEHYVSMVDLLGRAGYFTRVDELLLFMPVEPNIALWMCLLGSCRKHGNVELGRHAFDFAVQLQPQSAAAYVMMSNIYAQAGMWECSKEVELLRQKAGAGKKLGQTWIGHAKEINSYVVGDPQDESLSQQIRTVSRELGR